MTDREPSHYQRLGVTPAASTEEIRQAYRSLVARLHPDRLQGSSPADREFAERRTREVNEAWRVLRDPALRRSYDDERLGRVRRPEGTRPRPAAAAVVTVSDEDDDLVDVLPPMTGLQAGLFRHLPWVAIAVLLLGIFVVTAYAGGGADDGGSEGPVGRSAQVGECLDIPTGTATTIVPCSGPHDYAVVARVATVDECPEGTEARRLGTDASFDCLSTP